MYEVEQDTARFALTCLVYRYTCDMECKDTRLRVQIIDEFHGAPILNYQALF